MEQSPKAGQEAASSPMPRQFEKLVDGWTDTCSKLSDKLSVVVQLIGDYYLDHGPNGYG
jgi:hypothetical protein